MPDPLAGLPPCFLPTPEAARFLGLSGRTLEKHRTYGTGPKYGKIGGRVFCALDDLKAWADLGAKTSTSDSGAVTVLAKRVTLPGHINGHRHRPLSARPVRAPAAAAAAQQLGTPLFRVNVDSPMGELTSWRGSKAGSTTGFTSAEARSNASATTRGVSFAAGRVFAFIRTPTSLSST